MTLAQNAQVVNVTMTPEQHQMFLDMLERNKKRDLFIADMTGETQEEIEARYKLPENIDDILEDMADWQSQAATGIPMF